MKNYRHLRNKNIEIEEKYKFIVNAYGEMMTLINRQYIYELVNDSWCRTFGKQREDIIGKTVAEVWGSERFEAEIVKKINKCLPGNIFREEDLNKWHHSYGGGLWVSPYEMTIITTMYEFSEDEKDGLFSLRFGFLF